MDFSSLNFVAVLVAAVVAFIIGFMWHGPVFGKVWVDLMKITPAEIEQGKKDMQKKMPLFMLGSLMQQLLIATVIAYLSAWSSVIGLPATMSALILGICIWLVVAAVLLNGVLWEKRSVPLYLFNIAYQLVAIVVSALIVGLWK